LSINNKIGIVRCPKCGLINPRTATNCECGTDLSGDNIKGYNNKEKAKENNWRYLTQPIENENDASQVLSKISKILYIFALIFMVMGIIQIITQNKVETISVSPMYFFVGFFLKRRKSRALAIFLIAFAVIETIFTFISFGHTYWSALSIPFIILLLAMGYRSILATFLYHRSIKSNISWKNVFIVSTISLLISVIIFCLSTIFLFEYGYDIESYKSSNITMAIHILIIAPALGILTRWFPFSYMDNLKPHSKEVVSN
jgi:hypothetical protein